MINTTAPTATRAITIASMVMKKEEMTVMLFTGLSAGEYSAVPDQLERK